MDPIPRTTENAHLSLLTMMTPSPTEDPAVFVGAANPYGPIGIYGGHFLGQALAAGLETVEQPKTDRQRQIILAYLSDGPIVFASALPYGLPLETHRVTSLDHSVWFHRSVDTSEWMLFDQHSTAAADGRGMNRGEVYTADGILVLTVAQESMLREIPLDKRTPR